jgi:hypothetical protein
MVKRVAVCALLASGCLQSESTTDQKTTRASDYFLIIDGVKGESTSCSRTSSRGGRAWSGVRRAQQRFFADDRRYLVAARLAP